MAYSSYKNSWLSRISIGNESTCKNANTSHTELIPLCVPFWDTHERISLRKHRIILSIVKYRKMKIHGRLSSTVGRLHKQIDHIHDPVHLLSRPFYSKHYRDTGVVHKRQWPWLSYGCCCSPWYWSWRTATRSRLPLRWSLRRCHKIFQANTNRQRNGPDQMGFIVLLLPPQIQQQCLHFLLEVIIKLWSILEIILHCCLSRVKSCTAEQSSAAYNASGALSMTLNSESL